MEKEINYNKIHVFIGLLVLLLIIIVGRTLFYQGKPDSYFGPIECKKGYILKNQGSLCETNIMSFECKSDIKCSKGCYICGLLIVKDERVNKDIALDLSKPISTKYLFKGKVYDSYVPCFYDDSKNMQVVCDEVTRHAIVESVENIE